MPSKRVPNPQETIRIRRMPPSGELVAGEPIAVTGTITRADERTVTFRIPGYPVPVTVSRTSLKDDA